MDIDILQLIFYLLLADALFANLIAWMAQDWYRDRFPWLSTKLPLTRAWGVVYLTLVAWIGYLTFYA